MSFAFNRRWIGLLCAVGAVGMGLVYMTLAGAPLRYLGMNMAALAIGLVAFAATARFVRQAGHLPGVVTLALGAALLATALFGISVEGASRWVRLGSVVLQPSLIIVPFIAVAFAQARGPFAMAGLMLAALALAIQPDRAMAGVLAAGLAALALAKPDRWTVTASVAAVAAFGATVLRADTLPAVPFVDQVFYTAFGVHALAGAAVLGGALLLLVPALAGGRDQNRREVHAVFGAVWLAVIAAAALGNYPTPLVGYGGSAILGYLLSLSLLPSAPDSSAERARSLSNSDVDHAAGDNHDLRAFA